MGGDEYGRTKNYDSGDVYRTCLDFADRNAAWVTELRKQKARRSLTFYSKELEEAFRPLVSGELIKTQGVLCNLGECVPSHPHAGTHVILYMPADHPIPLLFHDPEIRFPTQEGVAVLIPAGQWHEVPLNTTGVPRYTIAYLYRVGKQLPK